MYPEWLPPEWHWNPTLDPQATILDNRELSLEAWVYFNALLHEQYIDDDIRLKIIHNVLLFKTETVPTPLVDECCTVWYSLPVHLNIQKDVLNLLIQHQPRYTIPWLETICKYALKDDITYDLSYLNVIKNYVRHKTDGDFIALLYVIFSKKHKTKEYFNIENITMVGETCLHYMNGIYPSLDHTSDDYVDFSPLTIQGIQYRSTMKDKQFLKELKKMTRRYLKKQRAQ